MAFAKISSWPRRAILHTTSKRETPGGSSGQDLCQRCNNVIRNFERAFTLPDGWGAQDKEVMFRLQEAALGLKQWKNSIRWCATPDHECFSEADNEKLVQLVLASLRKENSGLFGTIGQHISDVAKLLVFIEQLYIHGDDEEASRETKEKNFKRLDTALECLAMQLVPLSAYAELVFQPSHTIEFIPIAPSNTLQAMEARKRSSKPKDQQAPAFLMSSSDPMPSPQSVRAETSQEVTITQDLVLSPEDEAEIERFAVPDDTKGLHVLVEPTETSSDLAIDIIAVHGLQGDSYKTWTDSESGKLWLRDLLPLSQGFGNARIMTFGYDARPWLKSANKISARWFNFAESLLADVRSMRMTTNTPYGKPIMFIGHSLGGIVIKRALVNAQMLKNSMKYRDISQSTKSIVVFGTPGFEGEQDVEYRLAVQRIFEAAGVKQDEALEAINECSYMIADASEWLPRLSRQFLVTSFYEREKYNGVLVVDENQARGNFANQTTIGLDANHHTICQFASENDKGFAEVHRAMYMHLIKISKALDAEEHPPTQAFLREE